MWRELEGVIVVVLRATASWTLVSRLIHWLAFSTCSEASRLVEHISPCLHWTTCLSHSVHYLYNIWTDRHNFCVSHVRTTSIYASNHRTERSQLNNSQNSALFSFALNPHVIYIFQFCLTSHHYILHRCPSCHTSSNSCPHFLEICHLRYPVHYC